MLTKCRECATECSSEAPTCPKCGCPAPDPDSFEFERFKASDPLPARQIGINTRTPARTFIRGVAGVCAVLLFGLGFQSPYAANPVQGAFLGLLAAGIPLAVIAISYAKRVF